MSSTFQDMFSQLGVPLTIPTQIVIGMSAFLQVYWWAIVMGIFALSFAIREYYKTD